MNQDTFQLAYKIAEALSPDTTTTLDPVVSNTSVLGDYIGKNVFVRTVTFHFTGRVEAIDGMFVRLADAAWIADSGRWATALRTGELAEVEPYPDDVVVSLGSIVDVCEWPHDLPRTQK